MNQPALRKPLPRYRLWTLLVTAITALLALAIILVPDRVQAHGATMFPASRQSLCYFDALTDTGALDPYNSACQAAFDEVGTTPFYNWFGNLDSNGNGRTVGYIPDGRICDGGGNGPYDFRPLNDPGAWPQTHLTAGETIEWRHNNWAHHPGRFDLYITKPGWDPTQPLAWDDLEAFWTINDPDNIGGPGANDGYYYADLTLPEREGEHIIFTHWVRSDSQENFYSCSDVVFDGGNGEITGMNPAADFPGNDGPTATTSPTDEPTETPTSTETPLPQEGCSAAAQVNSWGSGANVTVEVTNDETTVINGWDITWTWPNSTVAFANGWSAIYSESGGLHHAANESWNGTLASGATATFGFNVTGSLSTLEVDCTPT